MKAKQQQIYFWVALLCAVATVFYTFSFTLSDPGHTLASLGGDSIKNYYTYLYHIMFDKGIWFTGMNYPYGEHITYTDAQPLLSVPLSYLRDVLDLSVQDALAIMHISIGLSYVAGFMLIYRILCYFQVHPAAAIVFSAIILFLSPQLGRSDGHFGLSHPFCLPLLFYWTIRYRDTGKLKYVAWFSIAAFLMTFLHPYFAGMACVWALFYILAVIIVKWRNLGAALRHCLPFLVAVVVIFGCVTVFMKLTDPITDRPEYPYGMLDSFLKWNQVLTSAYSPYWTFAREAGLYETPGYDIELNNYPGLLAIIVLVITALTWLYRAIRRRNAEQVLAGYHPVWLIMAIGVMIFTFGIPILWGGDAMIKYMPPLKQMRAIGRFAWMGYYLLTIFTAVVIYHHFKICYRSKKIIAIGVLVMVLVAWGLESIGYINTFRKRTDNAQYNYHMYLSAKEENWQQFLASRGKKASDFQAMLLLPFLHVGSEKIALRGEHGWLLTLGSKASLQLNLPIVDVLMSRTSWSQTFAQVKIESGPFVDKPLLQLADKRPFLLMTYFMPLPYDDEYIVPGAEYLGTVDECKVYACYPDSILAAEKRARENIRPYVQSLQPGKDTAVNVRGSLYIDHLDDDTLFGTVFGSGSRQFLESNEEILCDINVLPQADSQLFEASVWLLMDKKDFRAGYMVVELLDSSGKQLQLEVAAANHSTDNTGLWLRCAAWFHMPSECRRIRCSIPYHPYPEYLALDELVIRPADGTIISKDATGAVMVNNHRVTLQ